MTADYESSNETKTIRVGALTRVEGEGALHVTIRSGQIERVELAIYEPPRFFEALLRGRPLEETPDITARICGICPVAYQMTSIHALEQALKIKVSPGIRALRRLMYCGEWIESHGIHMHLLHIPDFFGCASSIELAKRFPDEVARGLRLKKIGNQLLEILGGRAAHPINAAVGGFYRVPTQAELRAIRDDLVWGLDAAIEVTRWVASFEYPELDLPCEMVAMYHPHEYPMNEGTIRSTHDPAFDVTADDFEQHFQERQVPHSTALQAVRLPGETAYYVGPLARINLNRQQLFPAAKQLSGEVGFDWPCFNRFKSIVARSLEVVHAFEEALQLIDAYREFQPARVEYDVAERVADTAEGFWATEAPRGTIFHRYKISSQGEVVAAKIVPPTSQNQRQMEEDLRSWLPTLLDQPEPNISRACEDLIRTFDPCISCSTHFLKLCIEHN
jgi:coenzyme F420-reducing hydrogenase alpha subunit